MVKKIGGYELESTLGQGSFGVVYLGKNSKTKALVACKSIPLNNPNPRILNQMETEIRVLKSAQCPYIIKLHDVVRSKSNLYIIMEYCPGGDLDYYIKANGRVPEITGRKWLGQLIDSFIYLQEKGIMHRDLKLANILLTNENQDVRLADFGMSRYLNQDSFASTQLGTPLFMAPEIFNTQSYTHKADVWSLGVLAYQVFTGVELFKCCSIAQLIKAQQEQINYPDYLSAEVVDFLRSMLRYNYNERLSFSDLKNHSFIRSALTESDEINDYEFCEDIGCPDIIEDEYEELEDEFPEVKIEPNFADLASRTMEIEYMLERVYILRRLGIRCTVPIILNAILKLCKKKLKSILELAEKVASDYELSSKDIIFWELYEKIQEMVNESPEEISGSLSINEAELLGAIKAEINTKKTEEIQYKLLLLEIATDLPSCPQSLKDLQIGLMKSQ